MPFSDLSTCNIGIFSLNHLAPLYQMYEFDLNQFRNPQAKPDFRTLYGTDPKVVEYLKGDPRLPAILDTCHLLAVDSKHRNRDYISFGFRDYHGRWISTGVAHIVGIYLSDLGFRIHISHRGISYDEHTAKGAGAHLK